LYGTNDEGAKSLLKKISQHGIQGECTEIGSSSRIFEIDIAAQNSTGLGNAQRDVPYDVTVSGARFSYDTWPGVFSQKKVDEGSQLLMESIPDLSGKSVLDLGCGAGILAMQAFNMGAERVHCRDVNAISTACTLHNLSAFGAKATVSCGYITEGVTEKFEVIVTNPPFHMGTQTHFDIGKEWLEGCSAALKPGGAIYLVANEFLRYSDFCKKLGFKVEKLATSPRFFVYKIVS